MVLFPLLYSLEGLDHMDFFRDVKFMEADEDVGECSQKWGIRRAGEMMAECLLGKNGGLNSISST